MVCTGVVRGGGVPVRQRGVLVGKSGDLTKVHEEDPILGIRQLPPVVELADEIPEFRAISKGNHDSKATWHQIQETFHPHKGCNSML